MSSLCALAYFGHDHGQHLAGLCREMAGCPARPVRRGASGNRAETLGTSTSHGKMWTWRSAHGDGNWAARASTPSTSPPKVSCFPVCSPSLPLACNGLRPVHAQALAGVHAVPRRRPHLPCRTTRRRDALRRRGSGQEVMAVLPAPTAAASAPRRQHVQPSHRHRQDELASDPQAWLARRSRHASAAHPAHRLDELLPWNWKAQAQVMSAKAA